MQVQSVLNNYVDAHVSVIPITTHDSLVSAAYKLVYAGQIIGWLFKKIEVAGGELKFAKAESQTLDTYTCNQIEQALNSKPTCLQLKKAIRLTNVNKI